MPAHGWSLGNFTAYVQWVLVNCGSSFTVCAVDEDVISPTLDPEPSKQPAKLPKDKMPESTAMPASELMPEHNIALDPAPNEESDQVCELATSSVSVCMLVKFEGMEWSPAHTPTTEGELHLASGKYYE